MPLPIQLYVHVPFCEKKCHYCDFASWELPAVQQRRWTEIILKELAARAPMAQGRPVDTVFFGGGTPSLLATEFLERILAEIRSLYDLSRMREMSIECNPSSLKKDKLDLYHRLGFTRMSIGIQSFHADELTRLGRVHTPETARLALETVGADGRFQFSGDLIFGVPGQTEAAFLASLAALLEYDTDHVSFYGLTIEDGTEFAKQQASGALIMPEDGIYNGMYTAGVELLRSRGYERYEVSNFSKPGRPSLHNQGYWNGVEYLAFGPGAHSFFSGIRAVSPRSFEGYLEWGARGFDDASCVREELTVENLFSEAVLLGLRQADGVDLDRIRGLGYVFPPEVLAKWEKVGMLAREGRVIRLIDEGWLFLDEISSDLLARANPAATVPS
ncbi:MAG: oxygen-independent coproporphyrinogen oxidase [Fibrobacteres bacterium]|nr:oxygen-independent coproporphyrinogen oxidase [Fibrobacterota bacterium]